MFMSCSTLTEGRRILLMKSLLTSSKTSNLFSLLSQIEILNITADDYGSFTSSIFYFGISFITNTSFSLKSEVY